MVETQVMQQREWARVTPLSEQTRQPCRVAMAWQCQWVFGALLRLDHESSLFEFLVLRTSLVACRSPLIETSHLSVSLNTTYRLTRPSVGIRYSAHMPPLHWHCCHGNTILTSRLLGLANKTVLR